MPDSDLVTVTINCNFVEPAFSVPYQEPSRPVAGVWPKARHDRPSTSSKLNKAFFTIIVPFFMSFYAPSRLLLFRSATGHTIDRRRPRHELEWILLECVERYLYRTLELPVVTADHVDRAILDFDIRRDAFVLD